LRQGAYRSWAEMERVSLPVGVDVNVVVNGIVDGDGDGDVSEMPLPGASSDRWGNAVSCGAPRLCR
jgi:hypothetical protein